MESVIFFNGLEMRKGEQRIEEGPLSEPCCKGLAEEHCTMSAQVTSEISFDIFSPIFLLRYIYLFPTIWTSHIEMDGTFKWFLITS